MLLLLGGPIGCGPPNEFTTYRVAGEVVFADGTPLRGGSVLFESESNVQGKKVVARGPINPDGTFSLGTNQPGDGAVAGWHRVSVHPPAPDVDVDESRDVPPIDVRFQDPRRSGLRFEVKPDAENRYTVEVWPPR